MNSNINCNNCKYCYKHSYQHNKIKYRCAIMGHRELSKIENKNPCARFKHVKCT